jgi:hypothetical protein
MMLGVVPAVNNPEQWLFKLKEEREKFAKLKEKVTHIFLKTSLLIISFNDFVIS